MDRISVQHLFEAPNLTSTVAKWIFEEFWSDKPGYTPQVFEEKLLQANDRTKIPLSLVGFVNDVPAGTVNLIENDDEARTHLAPWLAALVVQPLFRRKGLATKLVHALLDEAQKLRFKRVYLGTDFPEFYLRLGAEKHEHVKNEFYIFCFDLTKFRDRASLL